MAFPYIDTPRTEYDGNATYLTNGFRSAGRQHLSALDSLENSFQTPSKDNDVIKGFDKRVTPRAGAASKSTRSALRHLPATAPEKGEFTPLMKSATKNNFLRNMSAVRGTDGPKTPGYQRETHRSNAHTPGLPAMDMSDIYEEDRTMEEPTPVPHAASSSAQSTPLPGYSKHNGGVLGDRGNNLSLKDQAMAIDQLSKVNFSLKLRIHFMEEQLQKAGPEYNNEALKENRELKVLRVTMQRDISRYRKSLQQAEKDLEDYQLQLAELKEKSWRDQADQTVQREMDMMREELESRDLELREARDELRHTKDTKSQEIEKLRDDIEDLEASSREKDRLLEEREEELEDLKRNAEENGAASELQLELDRAKEQMQELHDSLARANSETKESQDAARQAIEEKDRVEEDLRELQDEMSNKSFTTKGLSRQMEDRTEKLEEEIRQLQRENDSLTTELESKTNHATLLEERYQTIQHGLEDNANQLVEDLSAARRDRDQARQELRTTSGRLQEALDELQRGTDEKELLQTRHNALTNESGGLQLELDRAQSRIRELQKAVQDATSRAQDEGHNLRWQHKAELERLQEEIENLHHEIEEKEGQFAVDQSRWESSKRTLQSEKEWAEGQVTDLKRTIDTLQEAGSSYSGKESRLQEAIDSEKKRYTQEKSMLNRQIQDLKDDLDKTRRDLDEKRDELLTAKQDARVSKREELALVDKVRALEDEVIVLQSSLADEQELAKGRQNGTSDLDKNLEKSIAERQKLRDQLANAHVEIFDLKTSAQEIEAERAELQAQLDRVQNADDTTRFDHEKLELRKTVTRLDNELKVLRDAKSSLEDQLISESERFAAEEGRLSAEIDRLQDKLLAGAGNRDRELTSAKTKVQRLERRTQELEALLEQQPVAENEQSGAHGDLSLLRHSLEEARKREKILLQRESKQKTSAQSYKSRVEELEKDLHDAMMIKFESHSPHNSPSNKLHEELRSLRKQVAEAHRSLQKVNTKNRELERAAMKEEDQKDFHELLRSSTLEAESLALKLSEREARLNELKTHVRRIREERDAHKREAEAATKNLDLLQRRHNEILEKTSLSKSTNKTKHEKEIRGLSKEIIWLRARLQREEKFRRDLAWSKGLMELGERVRVACNDADLRMISEMGVHARDRAPVRTPRHKLKSAISLVRAAVRMQKMSSDWKRTKKLGEGLKRAKTEMLKRRDSSNKSLLGQ
ncbi:Spindle associated [Penicillium cf. griseofulvum]|uniref:Spindle associated n=1 Tax=Penicillium cf. griseofulvum TaxID=2972120 RepID=A0A9W9J2U9_9EURO|nr:Spindle associated [Penicillium cf. griseofulvum]KAJ5434505.1 Spindle associated [Penicillium cf. griseofulvum]KAJ5452335.1 Spindle associated [Penicillium cf. griseofulvum]